MRLQQRIYIFVIAILIFGLVPPSHAKTPDLAFAAPCTARPLSTPPRATRIHLFPQKIFDVSEAQNTFTFRYYIAFSYPHPATQGQACHAAHKEIPNWVFNPKLELMNSEETDVTSDYNVYLEDGTVYVEWRGESVLSNDFNFLMYPFDSQVFQLKIMGLLPRDKMPFNFEEIDQESLQNLEIDGWKLKSDTVSLVQQTWDGEKYDEVTFKLKLDRQYLSELTRLVVPLLLIIVCGWASLLMPLRQLDAKLTLQVSSLIALIAFFIVLDAKTPRLSYLTLVDYIAFAGFLSLFSIIIFTAWQSRRLR